MEAFSLEWYVVALCMGVTLLVLLFMSVPVGVSLGLAGLPFLLAALGLQDALYVVGERLFFIMTSYSLIALPLFAFMASILFASGIGKDIYTSASLWLNRLPGGLALATVAGCAIFATLCGGGLAAITLFGMLAAPEMLRRGYNKRLATGSIVAAGGLAHLIPPSGLMIIYAWIIEESVADLFKAGIIPGVILAIFYGVVVVIWVKISPSAAPREPSVTWKKRLLSVKGILPGLAIVVLVLGAIFTGIATVTEAAGVGALASLILGISTRRLTWSSFVKSMIEVVRLVGFVMLIAAGAQIFCWVLTYYLIPHHLLDILLMTRLSPVMIVGMMMIMYLFLGMFLDQIGMLFITVPIIYPLLLGYGLSPIWFGILIMVNMETAIVTPPVGFGLYVLKGVLPADISIGDIFKGALPFIAADMSVLALVLFFPQLALWLPGII